MVAAVEIMLSLFACSIYALSCSLVAFGPKLGIFRSPPTCDGSRLPTREGGCDIFLQWTRSPEGEAHRRNILSTVSC